MFRPNFPHLDLIALLVLFLTQLLSAGCSSKQVVTPHRSEIERPSAVININAADAAELGRLPNIGPSLAAKIVEHRIRYGPFRKPEHLLVIEGVSDRRYQEIKHLVTTE